MKGVVEKCDVVFLNVAAPSVYLEEIEWSAEVVKQGICVYAYGETSPPRRSSCGIVDKKGKIHANIRFDCALSTPIRLKS